MLRLSRWSEVITVKRSRCVLHFGCSVTAHPRGQRAASGWRLLLPGSWFHSQSTIQKTSSKICGLFVLGPVWGHTWSQHAETFHLQDCACVKSREYEMDKYYFIIGDDDDDDVYSDSPLVCNQWVCDNYFRCSREGGGNSCPRGGEEVWLGVLRSASGIKAEAQQDAAAQAQQRSDGSGWLTAESESAALFVTFQKLLFHILFVFLWKACLFSSSALWSLLVETESLFHFFSKRKLGVLLLRWPTLRDRGWCLQLWSSVCWCVGAAWPTPSPPNRRVPGATRPRRTGPNTRLLSGTTSTSSPGRGQHKPGLKHSFFHALLRVRGVKKELILQRTYIFYSHDLKRQSFQVKSTDDKETVKRVTSLLHDGM